MGSLSVLTDVGHADVVDIVDLHLGHSMLMTAGRQDQYVAELVEAYGVGDEGGNFPKFWSDPFCLQDFRWSVLQRFLPRLAIAFVFYVTGLYFNNVSQAWLQTYIANYYEGNWAPIPPMNHSVVLFDATYHFLPMVSSTAPADTFAGAPWFLVVFRYMLLPGPMSLRWTITCRLLVMWGLLWLFRGVTIIVTPLPNPDFTCKPQVSFPDSAFMEAWANLPFVFWHSETTCQDVLYSGHTVSLTLGAMFLCYYWPRSPWTCYSVKHPRRIKVILYTLGTLFVISGYYFIVASHFHYTVDVLVGAMMTFLTFRGYHYSARMAWLDKTNRISLNPCLYWFERHAKDMHLWQRRTLRALELAHMEERREIENGLGRMST